jgi:Mg-chelatase subunit ChlD
METTTATANVNESMIRTAQDKLAKTAGCDSLDALVNARTRRSLLLVDVSGSMIDTCRTGETKIDALRKVVDTLLESHPVPVAAFGGDRVTLVEGRIPNPAGGTPMASAIRYAKRQGANHAVIVTDGQSGEYDVLDAASEFGGPIDTFYIGGGYDRHGRETAQEIARITGGVFNEADLGAPKQLGSKLRGLLGDGSL